MSSSSSSLCQVKVVLPKIDHTKAMHQSIVNMENDLDRAERHNVFIKKMIIENHDRDNRLNEARLNKNENKIAAIMKSIANMKQATKRCECDENETCPGQVIPCEKVRKEVTVARIAGELKRECEKIRDEQKRAITVNGNAIQRHILAVINK